MANDANVVKANTSTGAVHRRQGRLRHFGARFIIESIVRGKTDYGGIFASGAERVLFHHGLLVGGGKIREIANFHGTLWTTDLGDGRGLGNGQDFEFGDIAGGGRIRAFGGNRPGVWQVAHDEFHALGQARSAAAIEIRGILGDILDPKRSPEIRIFSGAGRRDPPLPRAAGNRTGFLRSFFNRSFGRLCIGGLSRGGGGRLPRGLERGRRPIRVCRNLSATASQAAGPGDAGGRRNNSGTG